MGSFLGKKCQFGQKCETYNKSIGTVDFISVCTFPPVFPTVKIQLKLGVLTEEVTGVSDQDRGC